MHAGMAVDLIGVGVGIAAGVGADAGVDTAADGVDDAVVQSRSIRNLAHARSFHGGIVVVDLQHYASQPLDRVLPAS